VVPLRAGDGCRDCCATAMEPIGMVTVSGALVCGGRLESQSWTHRQRTCAAQARGRVPKLSACYATLSRRPAVLRRAGGTVLSTSA
jgi:hypothetical protein